MERGSDTRIRILESVISEAKKGSIVQIKTTTVATKAKTSESNIYRIFKTKQNLLNEAFLYIDEQVGLNIIQGLEKVNLNSISDILPHTKNIWLAYLEFFVKHRNYAEYYSYFRKSKLYSREVAKQQEKNYGEFLNLMAYVFKEIPIYRTLPYNLFWSFILDSTLMIAQRMAIGEIEYCEENVNFLFNMIFDGLFSIFKINKNSGGKNEEN